MSETLSYTLKRHSRSRHIRIRIHADHRIVVTAPPRVSIQRIDAFFEQKKNWIAETLRSLPVPAQFPSRNDISQENLHACRARATKYIRDRLVHFNTAYGFVYHRISIKKMTSRWGSCSSEGNMSFDYRLLFLPSDLADYVIVHELCHLKELNHSARFWRLVGATIPDYRGRKRSLDRYAL